MGSFLKGIFESDNFSTKVQTRKQGRKEVIRVAFTELKGIYKPFYTGSWFVNSYYYYILNSTVWQICQQREI